MHQLADILLSIQKAFGYHCRVSAFTNEIGGITIRLESSQHVRYGIERTYCSNDIADDRHHKLLLADFIDWANEKTVRKYKQSREGEINRWMSISQEDRNIELPRII